MKETKKQVAEVKIYLRNLDYERSSSGARRGFIAQRPLHSKN